jgi:hypothetical protein
MMDLSPLDPPRTRTRALHACARAPSTHARARAPSARARTPARLPPAPHAAICIGGMIEPDPSVAETGMQAGPLCLRLLKKNAVNQTVEPTGTDAGNVTSVSMRPVLPSNLNADGSVGASAPTYENKAIPETSGGRALLFGSFGFAARTVTVCPFTRVTLSCGLKSGMG